MNHGKMVQLRKTPTNEEWKNYLRTCYNVDENWEPIFKVVQIKASDILETKINSSEENTFLNKCNQMFRKYSPSYKIEKNSLHNKEQILMEFIDKTIILEILLFNCNPLLFCNLILISSQVKEKIQLSFQWMNIRVIQSDFSIYSERKLLFLKSDNLSQIFHKYWVESFKLSYIKSKDGQVCSQTKISNFKPMETINFICGNIPNLVSCKCEKCKSFL